MSENTIGNGLPVTMVIDEATLPLNNEVQSDGNGTNVGSGAENKRRHSDNDEQLEEFLEAKKGTLPFVDKT